jgi:hypothetical protein
MASKPTVDRKRTGLKAAPVVFELDDGCLPDHAEPGAFELQGSLLLLACPAAATSAAWRWAIPSRPDRRAG